MDKTSKTSDDSARVAGSQHHQIDFGYEMIDEEKKVEKVR